MDYVNAQPIVSPYTGGLVQPRMKSREYRGKIYTEAHWVCPDSGNFIRKGLVKVEDIKKKES